MFAAVLDLLTEWGLQELHDSFQTQEVDIEAFNELTSQDITYKLIPQLGFRKKFIKQYEAYKNKLKETVGNLNKGSSGTASEEPRVVVGNLVELCDPSSLDINQEINIDQSTVQNSKGIDCVIVETQQEENNQSPEPAPKRLKPSTSKKLADILKQSINGKIILSLHKSGKYKKLPEKYRNSLTEVIVAHYISLSPSYLIEFKIFDQISGEIVELFPEEDKEIYYIPPFKKTLVKGKLPNKYHNLRKELKEVGIISKNETVGILAKDQESTSAESNLNDTAALTWLKLCGNSAWHEIEVKWAATSKIRLAKLRSPAAKGEIELLVADYFKEYPCLKKTSGVYVEEFDSVEAILRFSDIFSPVTLRARSGTKCWKATKAEMQDGFVIHVKVIGDLPERIKRRKEKLASINARFQPLAVVVGLDTSSIVSSFVVFDDIRYEVESPERAVDVCFKAYHSLHAVYPPESEIMWMILQKLVYKFDTKWDKKSSTLQKMLVDLK